MNTLNPTTGNVKSGARHLWATGTPDAADRIRRALAQFSTGARRMFTICVPVWIQSAIADELAETLDGVQVEGEVLVTLGSGTYTVWVGKHASAWHVFGIWPGAASTPA